MRFVNVSMKESLLRTYRLNVMKNWNNRNALLKINAGKTKKVFIWGFQDTKWQLIRFWAFYLSLLFCVCALVKLKDCDFGSFTAEPVSQELSSSGLKGAFNRSELIRIPKSLECIRGSSVKLFIVLRLNCNHLTQHDRQKSSLAWLKVLIFWWVSPENLRDAQSHIQNKQNP